MRDIVIGPDYARAPQWAPREGVPAGTVHSLVMRSSESGFFPGIRRVDNAITRRRDRWGNRIAAEEHEQSEPCPYLRTVWTYVPTQVKAPAPLLLVQDGSFYARTMPFLLDNLIAERRVPPLVAVFVDNGGGDAQGSQRGLEYDTLSPRYGDFIESEVLPRVVKEYGVALSDHPRRRATMGVSSGAACAFTMAWERPDRYGKVLSYSGTFVNQQSPVDAVSPRGAWEYHATILPNAERKPIKIWMQVGERDLHHDDPEESWHNWPLANRRMAAVLADKGYDYRFVFARGAAHVDQRVDEQTLPGALAWLWRDKD